MLWIRNISGSMMHLDGSRWISCVLLLALWGCRTSGNTDGANLNGKKEVVCFVYHRFGDDRFPSTNVSLDHFRAHLQLLKDQGIPVMNFTDAIEFLETDQTEYRRVAVITIDDGYRSFYQNGLPLLEAYDLTATLFINTESVGGADYMDWEQLKDAGARGIEIGNHSQSHAYFLNQPEGVRYVNFQKELTRGQKLIEENLGEAPKVFAYPFGEFDLKMKEIVREAGFIAAAAQNSGVMYSGTDLFQCPRFPMSEFYSDPAKFASKLNMHPLRVLRVSPEHSILSPADTVPELVLEFEADSLQTDQLQCFVQGGECEVSRERNNDRIRLRARSGIADRRRTLYTVTVPDTRGEWYWYSHLWINPEVNP